MKIHGLSSNPKSKTGVGGCAQDRHGFVSSTASTARWGARREQLGVAPLPVGGTLNNFRAAWRSAKRPAGGQRAPRDVKNEGTSGDVHENKGQATICPTQKAPFLPGRMPFYTELHVFCGNRWPFCNYSSPGECTPRFKMWKLEGQMYAQGIYCPSAPAAGSLP